MMWGGAELPQGGPLRSTAFADDGTLMALAHETLPIFGVQFHPESVLTEHGHALLANFLALAVAKPREKMRA